MLKLFGALVILGLALAWITSWVLDSYDTAWHPKRSVQHPTVGDRAESKGSSPPFPGEHLSNIFWFVQVGYCSVYSEYLHLTGICLCIKGELSE